MVAAAWNRGVDEAEADLGRPSTVARARPGAPPKALRKALKAYPDPEAWRWCAYALATSWQATQPDAFDGYGFAWVVNLAQRRLDERMALGQDAQRRGRAATKVDAVPPSDVWAELVKLVLRTPQHQPTPVEGPLLESLRAIGGAREIRAADSRRLAVLRGQFLEAFALAKLGAGARGSRAPGAAGGGASSSAVGGPGPGPAPVRDLLSLMGGAGGGR